MNLKKGLALFLCLAILLSSGAGAAFASVKISAKLISMEGDVQIIRAGGEKPFKAFVNMRLTEGDRIITGADGTAKVQMEDDVIITLAENTRIYLSELRGSQGAQQSSINLQSGAVGSSVGKKLTDNSRFEIKTPTAVMGVRGTEFFTQYYNGNVDVRVVNGTVEVSVSITATGGVAGPGATAVQTYTFPVTSLQQVNFGQETPLSQLQQPPQPLGLIGLPLPFLDRVQEINQQVPGTIPQNIINTIDQAVESARILVQTNMNNPNIVPSELESFIAGRIAGNLLPGLPNFGLQQMQIIPPPPPPPPQFFPPSFGGGGSTIDFGGDDGGNPPPQSSTGSIIITSVTPGTGLTPGGTTSFIVNVSYNFSGMSQAELGIGFNSGDDVNIFNMIDDASQVVTNSSGTHTFEVSSMVKDWGEDGDFKVYVNISEVNHESSWTPLDSDEMVLGVQSIDDTLTINGIIREGGTANGLEEVEIKIYSGHPVYNDVIAGPIYSDSSGNYTIAGIPEGTGYYIFFAKDGWVSFGEALNIETGQQELNLNNSMTPTGNGKITGRIVDSSEQGIQDVNVSLYYNNQIYPDQYLSVIVNTNEFGEYELRNIKFLEQVPEDGLYKIRFERTGYEVVEIEVSSQNYLVDPEIPYTINIDYLWEEAVSTGRIHGTVTQFSLITPVYLSDVEVVLKNGQDQTIGTANTDVDGFYQLMEVPLNQELGVFFLKDGYLISERNNITLEEHEPDKTLNKVMATLDEAGYLVISSEFYTVNSYEATEEQHLDIEFNSISQLDLDFPINNDTEVEYFLSNLAQPSGVLVNVKNEAGEIKAGDDTLEAGDILVLEHTDSGLIRKYVIILEPVAP